MLDEKQVRQTQSCDMYSMYIPAVLRPIVQSRPVRFVLQCDWNFFICCLPEKVEETTKGQLVYLIYESADIRDCWIGEGKAYCVVENINHVKRGAE